MTDPVRVLIADDHALFRRGIAELINEHEQFDLVGEAEDGQRAVELARRLRPDVVLMDVHMPRLSGIGAVRRIKADDCGRILMLTVSDKDEDLLAAIKAGADGYLLKNADPQDLFRAILHVSSGRGALSPEVTAKVLAQVNRPVSDPGPSGLTPREGEVLRLVATGATTAQIALDLGVQSSTVKTHIHNLLRKLDSANRAEAVARAASLGLLDKSDID